MLFLRLHPRRFCIKLIMRRSAERVDDIMEKVEDEQDLMNQISEAISRPAEDMFDDVSVT